MLNNMGLGFIFTARDFASAKMQGLERRFTSLDQKVTGGADRMTAAFKQIGVGLAIFTAGAMAVGGGLALANAAGKFEQGLASVGAVSRATTRDLGMLKEAAIQAGIETQFSPTEAVEGLQSLATAGQTATQATQTLVPVLDLAAGSLGQLGVAAAAEAVVGTLNAYGMAAEQSVGVTDKLLRITQLTNFQTRDFETGLSKAAAAGATFGQRMDDVLITMGLLRNRNIDASSSATAFREAVRRVGADSRAQQAVLGAGVDVFDETSGKMRSIVDIMSDFARATEDMTDKERNRRVTAAFGARGLLAFNAIQKAAFTTMKDGAQVTLQGAEAIAALRGEMGQAEGTAAAFRDTLLDTFEGQKTLLGGTLQTLAVVLGEPFSAIFKPLVGGLVDMLNSLLRAFQAIPAPIKKMFAGVITAAGAVLALVGGAIAAKGAFALLAIGLKAVGLSLSGVMSSMLPLVLIIGVVSAAVAGLRVAYEENLGGFGDFVKKLKARSALFFNGMKQIFDQGGFSGAVREELARAENQGLKRFLVGMYKMVHRLQRVWQGFKEGFTRTIEGARDVFKDLVASFRELGEEISAAFSELTGNASDLPSEQFREFGDVAGAALAGVVKWTTKLIAVLTRVTSGIISGFRSMKEHLGPAFDTIGGAIDDIKETWGELVGSTNDATGAAGESTESWKSVGEVIGQVIGGIVTFIGLVIAGLIKVVDAVLWVVTGIKDIFVVVGTAIGEGLGAVVWFLTETLPSVLSDAWDRVTEFFEKIGEFFSGVGAWFKDLFASIAGSIQAFAGKITGFFDGIRQGIKRALSGLVELAMGVLRKIPDALLPEQLITLKSQGFSFGAGNVTGRTDATNVSAGDLTASMPAASETGRRSQDLAGLTESISALANARSKRDGDQPLNVKLEVDGETIAQASHSASRDAAGRSFSPVPVY